MSRVNRHWQEASELAASDAKLGDAVVVVLGCGAADGVAGVDLAAANPPPNDPKPVKKGGALNVEVTT